MSQEIVVLILKVLPSLLLIPVWKKGIEPWLKKRRKRAEKRAELEAILRTIPEEMSTIKKQLFPNGGSSLFDLYARLNNNYQSLEARFDEMEVEQKIRLGIQKIVFAKSNALGEFTYVSPMMCKMLDRDPKELLRYGWKSYISKKDFQRVEDAWEAHMEEVRFFDEQFGFIDTEGNVMNIHWTAYPMEDKIKGKYKGSYITILKLP